MAKDNPTRGTRLPDEMDDEFQRYRDEKEMNNSEALRELVRLGLEVERNADTTAYSAYEHWFLSVSGVLATVSLLVAVASMTSIIALGDGVAGASVLLVTSVLLLIFVDRGYVRRLLSVESASEAGRADVNSASE